MIDLQTTFASVAGDQTDLISRESDSDSEINEARNLTLEMPDPDNPLDKFLKQIETIAEYDPQAARIIALAESDSGRFQNASKLEDLVSKLNIQLGYAATDPNREQEPQTPVIKPGIAPTPGGFA